MDQTEIQQWFECSALSCTVQDLCLWVRGNHRSQVDERWNLSLILEFQLVIQNELSENCLDLCHCKVTSRTVRSSSASLVRKSLRSKYVSPSMSTLSEYHVVLMNRIHCVYVASGFIPQLVEPVRLELSCVAIQSLEIHVKF